MMGQLVEQILVTLARGQRSKGQGQMLKMLLFPPYLCNALRYFLETQCRHVLLRKDSPERVSCHKVKGQKVKGQVKMLQYHFSRKWFNVSSWNLVYMHVLTGGDYLGNLGVMGQYSGGQRSRSTPQNFTTHCISLIYQYAMLAYQF